MDGTFHAFEGFPFAKPGTSATDYRVVALEINSAGTAGIYVLKRATASGTELVIGSEPLTSPGYNPSTLFADRTTPDDLFHYRWNLTVPVSDRIWIIPDVTSPLHGGGTFGGWGWIRHIAIWIADGRIYLLPFGPQ